jgi:F0F1-type ATP synthase membrane subunit a
MALPWIMIAIAVIIVILAIFMIFVLKGKKRTPPDYYAFFWIGICWMVIGIPLSFSSKNHFFFIMGLVFFAIGIVNKDKWKKNRALQKKWKKLSKTEKWTRISIILALALGVFVLFIYYVLRCC